jgi:hypothetical protein
MLRQKPTERQTEACRKADTSSETNSIVYSERQRSLTDLPDFSPLWGKLVQDITTKKG